MMRSRFSRLCNLAMLVALLFATCAVDVKAVSTQAVSSDAPADTPEADMPTEARGVYMVDGVTVPWEARHGITGEQFQAAFDELGSQGFRPVQVSGYAFGDSARYSAIWEQRGGPALETRHGLTNAQYQQLVNDLSAAGYRPLWVSGYTINNEDRYATIWEQSSGPAWIARHGISNAQYQSDFNDFTSQGYRLVQVSGYAISNQDYYTSIWEKRDTPAWQGRHNLTAEQYQQTVNELSGQGYRPLLVNGYTVNNEARFATIWEQSSGPGWEARHGLTNGQYQETFTNLAIRGFNLKSVSGYTVGGQDYYAAIWEHTVEPFTSLPQSGNAVPELAVFDQTMQNYMVTRQIPAGTLTVMRDGVIVFERGYGWQDRDQTVVLQPDAMMRLASIIKPVTEAAILQLIDEDELSADDRVFCLTGSPANCILNITPSGTEDANAVNITIQHLMDHMGGWDRDISGDPMFDVIDIASDLGVTSPPSKEDIVRYMLGRPLDHVPGTTYAYSNFGYLLLGLVIEEITGQSYTDHIQEEIFAPLCVPRRDIELGRSLPNQRNPREPWYADPNTATNVFDTSQTVLFPDGGYYIEAMEAHGGMIASGSAMAKFLDGYWISGEPRTGDGQEWWFFGSLPGTHTLIHQRPDGINIVALFNQRTDPSGANYDDIKNLLDAAATSVTTWPSVAQQAQGAALPQANQQALCLFPAISILVDPAGSILKSLDEKTSVIFPENVVTAPISVTLTPKLLTVGNNFKSINQFFDLNAVDENEEPVTTFANPLTIVTELPDDLGGVNADSFKLFWQDGDNWSTEGLTTVSREGNLLTSTTTHFSTFAVLAETQPDPDPDPDPDPETSLYLPAITTR